MTMFKAFRKSIVILAVFLFILLPSCSSVPIHASGENFLAYTVTEDDSLLSRFMPVFVIENYKNRHNLIGTASAKDVDGKEEAIYINPDIATVYAQIRLFKTSKSRYTNLVYRVHFEKIPGGLIPFYLGKGKNTGLIVIVTLNKRNKPILYTTVHTCGCYLAFVPTSLMPVDNFPKSWDKRRQSVDFENLPGILDYNDSSPEQEKTMILFRDGSHRVKDIWLSHLNSLDKFKTVKAQIKPLDSLKKLPLKDHITSSFFENSGSRVGYVKGSYKIREWLFMSWWAFDSRVGEDKVLGKDKNDGILFYTSLKPWAREKSDMRDFVSFLKYWDWEL